MGEYIEEDTESSRLARIVGHEGVDRLAHARVLVLGLGGVGSNCLEALARGGVGSFVLVDHDVVARSNINRQAIALQSTIGRPKAECARSLVLDINPNAKVTALQEFVYADDVDALLGQRTGRIDYIVDAIDSVSTKLAVALWAQEHDVPLISSMGTANKLFPECFRVADIYDTVNCPLCRIVRKEARKRGIKALTVAYSSEMPVSVAVAEGSERRDRSDLGTMSYAPPIMGQIIAGYVLRSLLGLPLDAAAAAQAQKEADAAASQKARAAELEKRGAPIDNSTEARTFAGGTPARLIAGYADAANGTSTPSVCDAHCHISFAPDPHALAQQASAMGIEAWSSTVTPADYRQAREQLEGIANMHVGLGLHPWWIADGRAGEADLAAFERAAASADFIGEIGLDFAGRCLESGPDSRERQLAVFSRILEILSGIDQPKIVSLHAVASYDDMLAQLEMAGTPQQHRCIFHWFSGSQQQLRRAIELGCFFSIGPRSVAGKRGRALVRLMPPDRIFLETDWPAHEGETLNPETWKRTLEELDAAYRSL